MLKKIINLSILCCALLLTACLFTNKITIKGKGDIKLQQVDFSDLQNWSKDDHKQALQAFLHSCHKFSKMAQNRLIGGQIGEITVGDFRDVCDIAEVVKTMSAKQAQNFFENWFKPFLVESRFGNSKGLFTGYYEASLNGSKVKSEKFKYPLYAKPKDLGSDPYLSRREIESGALKNKDLEVIYVDDKVDLFFMHIQGSGRVRLPSGAEVRVAYAGRNNQPFTGVANYMADHGMIERSNMSAASVREWLKKNPEKADEVMNINAAYTFFKIADGEYVVGGQGVPLTTEHSLAVDSEIMPYGFPLWVETDLRRKDGHKEKYDHLFIAQDTGSAIKGVVRGDIFFGHGIDAEEKASYMASQGKYYALLPINVVDKIGGR
jgi:membrane-bound lytic murein transglycosylase A